MQIFRLYARWNSARLFLLFFALVCISSVAALPIPSVKARSQTANTYLHYDLTAFATSTAVPANKRNEVEGHTKKGLLAKLQSEGYETLILAPAIKSPFGLSHIPLWDAKTVGWTFRQPKPCHVDTKTAPEIKATREGGRPSIPPSWHPTAGCRTIRTGSKGEPKFIEVGDKKLVGFGAFVKAKKKDAAPGPLELLQEEVNLKLKGQGFNVQEHLPEGALKRHRRTTTSLVVFLSRTMPISYTQFRQLSSSTPSDSTPATPFLTLAPYSNIYTPLPSLSSSSIPSLGSVPQIATAGTASTSGSTSESASATIAIPTTVLPTITHTKGPRYDLSSLPMASGYRLPSPPTSAPTSAPFPVRTSPSANEPGLEKSMKHIKHRIKKVAKSYLIHELSQDDGESPKLSWDQTMDALFGDHVQWREVTEGVFVHEESATRYIPTCRITGLPAKYLDPRTGLPFANLWAYRILRRLAGEVLSPPSSKGELPSDGNRGVGLGGDDNGSPTTADDADFECHGEIGVWDEDLGCYVGDWESTGTVSRGVVDS
ncbi:hypothetical protein EV361DRAFT_946738 [Lentinula raphanica]|nr:hypothetical protein EV361DRAFT_946738 [Lentinula raphanica]